MFCQHSRADGTNGNTAIAGALSLANGVRVFQLADLVASRASLPLRGPYSSFELTQTTVFFAVHVDCAFGFDGLRCS